jgi:hypothetical protein
MKPMGRRRAPPDDRLRAIRGNTRAGGPGFRFAPSGLRDCAVSHEAVIPREGGGSGTLRRLRSIVTSRSIGSPGQAGDDSGSFAPLRLNAASRSRGLIYPKFAINFRSKQRARDAAGGTAPCPRNRISLRPAPSSPPWPRRFPDRSRFRPSRPAIVDHCHR